MEFPKPTMLPQAIAVAAFVLWFGWTGSLATAQVQRLPEVAPASEAVRTQLLEPSEPAAEAVAVDPWPLQVAPPAGRPDTAIPPGMEGVVPPASETLVVPDPDRPPGARDGFFQKITFQSTWLAGGDRGDSFGMTDLELKTILALPIPSRKYPLIITPGFAEHLLEGPELTDLPSRVYDAYVQFRWMRRLTPKLAVDLAVSPGVYSDFEHDHADALRITGYGAGMYTWSPTTKLVLGAAYLDRENLSVLPIGGIIWKPNEDWNFELMAPKPQIAHRIYWEGASTEKEQDWVYLAGEYGGGTWAIERTDGTSDTFTYSDYRVLLGLERKSIGGLGGWVETGFVFGREIEYGSHTRSVYPPGTVLLRAGLTY